MSRVVGHVFGGAVWFVEEALGGHDFIRVRICGEAQGEAEGWREGRWAGSMFGVSVYVS